MTGEEIEAAQEKVFDERYAKLTSAFAQAFDALENTSSTQPIEMYAAAMKALRDALVFYGEFMDEVEDRLSIDSRMGQDLYFALSERMAYRR